MPACHPLEQKLAQLWPPPTWADLTLLVAVSGGPDSVALLRAVIALHAGPPGRIVAAHYNHRLRGDQSDHDQQFVTQLAHQWGIPCEIGDPGKSGLMLPPGQGLEAAARTARYEFLKQAARRCGARYVATAHSADDQAETVLHRIIRGTALAGLAGMPRARQLSPGISLIRPLLSIRRDQLRDYLRDLGQTFCHDSSNQSLQPTRNRIRHELLPRIAAQYNPQVVEALLRLAGLADQTQQLLSQDAAALRDRCLLPSDEHALVIDTASLTNVPRCLVRELLIAVWRERRWPERDMDYARWDQLATLALAPAGPQGAGKLNLPGNVTAQCSEGRLVLLRQ